MLSHSNSGSTRPRVEDLAREVLADLFAALSGQRPRSLRAYREGDALLLLLRFDPELAGGGEDPEREGLIDGSFIAMLEMVTDAVSERLGCDVVPGNLSVCAPTGLAVFAMRIEGDHQEPSRFRIGSRAKGALRAEGLRLVR